HERVATVIDGLNEFDIGELAEALALQECLADPRDGGDPGGGERSIRILRLECGKVGADKTGCAVERHVESDNCANESGNDDAETDPPRRVAASRCGNPGHAPILGAVDSCHRLVGPATRA